MIAILDVSHHNGNVDFKKAVSANPQIQKVIVKATEGTSFVDPKFATNVARVMSIPGLKLGAYHFARLVKYKGSTKHEAALQAMHFVNTLKSVKADFVDIVLDIETNDDRRNREAVAEFIEVFASTVEKATGKQIVLYSYYAFLNENLPVGHKLGRFALWLAQYTKASKSKLPNGWSKVYMWQHTDSATLAAVPGKFDASVYGNTK